MSLYVVSIKLPIYKLSDIAKVMKGLSVFA